MTAVWRWIFHDAWVPIWPNLAANLIWVTPVFVLHHLLIRRHITTTVTATAPQWAVDLVDQMRETRDDLAVIHEIADQFEQLRDRLNEHINLCHDHPWERP